MAVTVKNKNKQEAIRMKKYYVNYYRDFANTYTLAWAETPEQVKTAKEAGYQQITRKKAEALCAKEKEERKQNPSFSGYADTVILPIDYPATERDWRNDHKLEQRGNIVYRI
jgi:hypothetical protein